MHWVDPDFLPDTKGRVERFIVNPHGEIDGLILTYDDKKVVLVHVPPHLDREIETSVRPGDEIRVRGIRPRNADMIAAIALTTADGRTIVDDGPAPSSLRTLIVCRPLMVFAGCALLFHMANAAMLPLVGQKLALQDKNLGTSLMSACIVAAQIVMVPMALLVGAKADQWGRKPLFLAAFLILPIRGVLYTLSDDKSWLVGVQLLDGVGAGIYGAIFPIIVADLMRGTGRFSSALGAVNTAQGIGAALSTTLAGIVVVNAGYSAAFNTLAAVAAGGVLLFYFAMPETPPKGEETEDAAYGPRLQRMETA
jgi:hypothetical protein